MKFHKLPLHWTITGSIFFGLYLMGAFFPNTWWGTHALAFLSTPLQVFFMVAGILAFVIPIFWPLHLQPSPKTDLSYQKMLFGLIVIAVGMAALFYLFPIYRDFYGDAVRFANAFGEKTIERPDVYIDHLFSFDFWHPRNGERSVLGSALFLSYKFGLSHLQAFKLIGVTFGFAYVFLWLFLVVNTVRNRVLRIIFAIAGLSAPFLLVFMGHIEIYAPSIAGLIAYFLVLSHYFKTHQKWYLWLTLFVLYFCLKFHSSAFLLVPSFIITLLYHTLKEYPKLKQYFNWKKLAIYVLAPIFLVGAGLYFFYYQDYNDPRFFYTNFKIHDRMFLPILSPEPPYDRYNLLGFNHVFDYLNMFLLWSPLAIFLLVIVYFKRKEIDWNAPMVIVSGLSLILYTSLLFMVNPLLGMQFDWDLFSLPAPILLIFVLSLFAQFKDTALIRRLIGPSLAIALWTMPIFPANVIKEPLSYRLESLGIRTFKSYWIRATAGIRFGINLLPEDKSIYQQRYIRAIEELRPYAIPGNDVEYAELLYSIAFHYLRNEKNYTKALRYAEAADSYEPNDYKILTYLIEANFSLKQFDKAYALGLRLIALNQNPQKSLRIAIHCALEAEKQRQAVEHCTVYLQTWPQDKHIQQVYFALQNGTDLDQIKQMFARKP